MKNKINKKKKRARKHKKKSDDQKSANSLERHHTKKTNDFWVVYLKPPKGFNSCFPSHLITEHFIQQNITHALGTASGYFNVIANTLIGGPLNGPLVGCRSAATDGWTYNNGYLATDHPEFLVGLDSVYQKYQVLRCWVEIIGDVAALNDSIYLTLCPSYDNTFQNTNPVKVYSFNKSAKTVTISSSRSDKGMNKISMSHSIQDISGLSGLSDMELIANATYFAASGGQPVNPIGYYVIWTTRDGAITAQPINLQFRIKYKTVWYDQFNETG